MKKRDALLLVLLLLVGIVLLLAFRLKPQTEDAVLTITVDGEIFGEYSLKTDQVIDINRKNICEIKDGAVSMTDADCPDQLCVHMASIDSRGGTIVCLPNKVVLTIETADTDEDMPDVITGTIFSKNTY